MAVEEAFGTHYLKQRILTEFALAGHIGITVETATDRLLVLSAPLAANSNYKGTAFAGSLFSLAALTGWAWLTRYIAQHELGADVVIQASEIHYLAPVTGEFKASLLAPDRDDLAKFRKMLQRAGRGRIRLLVDIHDGAVLATRFEGLFAAAARGPQESSATREV
jgi:thioesterase domain-containing protein